MGTKKVPFLVQRLNNNTLLKTKMFQRAAAAPLSMRSSVRPFAAQCNNNKRHQRAPASISMTRRRHHVVSASFSVSDITGPVNDTVNDLKSTEGLKKLGVRVSMHAPATIMASTVFGLFPTMGACMEACGLGAPGGPLASLAGPLLFSTAGQVASVSAGVAGMLGVGDQRVRVSLRAYGDYVEQLRRGYVESSVLAYGCGQENRIGRTWFGHGDVAVVAESDGVCQF